MRAARTQFNIRAIQASWKVLDDLVHLHPIVDENEYDHMVSLMHSLLGAVGDDEEHPLSNLLDLIGDLVSRYEQKHHFIEQAEPKDTLRFLMEAGGFRQEDLAGIVHQGNLSAILAGKRKISAALAGKLGNFFKVSAAVFIPH